MMPNQTSKTKAAQLHAEAGLIYIRAPSKVETKADGNTKKIKANFYPKDRNLITEQTKYNKGSGDYYSLLMGREFLPGRFVLLLDFDKKDEVGFENGMKLLDKLKMDSRNAPCQKTPSGGKQTSSTQPPPKKSTSQQEQQSPIKTSNITWTLSSRMTSVLAPRQKSRATANASGQRAPATN